MQIFHALLRLYPPEYRSTFAPEMLTVLQQASQGHKPAARARFVLKESFGLMRGAVSEWAVKLVTHDRYLQDNINDDMALPDNAREAEKQVKLILSRMENAIATHQFEKARFYSNAERKARENLCFLQGRH